jgi:hypothetical protein
MVIRRGESLLCNGRTINVQSNRPFSQARLLLALGALMLVGLIYSGSDKDVPSRDALFTLAAYTASQKLGELSGDAARRRGHL